MLQDGGLCGFTCGKTATRHYFGRVSSGHGTPNKAIHPVMEEFA
jgi:hypothetical protein